MGFTWRFVVISLFFSKVCSFVDRKGEGERERRKDIPYSFTSVYPHTVGYLGARAISCWANAMIAVHDARKARMLKCIVDVRGFEMEGKK